MACCCDYSKLEKVGRIASLHGLLLAASPSSRRRGHVLDTINLRRITNPPAVLSSDVWGVIRTSASNNEYQAMFRPTLVLACTIVLSSISVAAAAPLDAPGTVYIDGLPCNRTCQEYMAWSRQASGRQAGPQSEARVQPMAEPFVALKSRQSKKSEPPKPTSARFATPNPTLSSAPVLRARTPADTVAMKTAPVSGTSVPTPPPNPRAGLEAAAELPAQIAVAPPAQELAQAPAPIAPTASVEMSADNKDIPPVVAGPLSDAKKAPDAATATDTSTTALATAKANQAIAILLVREEISSVADLSNKKVAIDASQTSEVPDIKTAIARAGAINVEVSEDTKFALGRVMDGEVPAGIITLATPEEAAQWTGVPGFKVLRLPIARGMGGRG